MDAYVSCPVISTPGFDLRLVRESDADALFHCYHDQNAVRLMNDDNCDFGFYVPAPAKMAETIGYWLDFYQKRCFIRFAIVDKASGQAVGTVEGFGGETGVLRVDIAAAYEKAPLLSELFTAATQRFRALFGNEYLVTKAIPEAAERRAALAQGGWEYINQFRDYDCYYQIPTA